MREKAGPGDVDDQRWRNVDEEKVRDFTFPEMVE